MDKIQSNKYLQSESYYSDLYDRITVERCRLIEKEDFDENKFNPDNKLSPEEYKKCIQTVKDIQIFFLTGERYKEKSQTIRKWMEEDERRDQRLENAQPLSGIKCLNCGREMRCFLKDLHGSSLQGTERVLFFYNCPSCRKGRAFFEDGEELRKSKPVCPKCATLLEIKYLREGEKIITTDTCPRCGYQKIDEIDLSEEEKKKIDPDYEKDRERFCLTKEKGLEYFDAISKLKQLKELMDEQKEREKNKVLYDELEKTKKINIAELKDLLDKSLSKEGYTKLEFSQPEMGKEVIISFTVQEDRIARDNYDSRMQLKKLIDKVLFDTNWKLMYDGINDRLGILSGRLRGLEDEKDLLELIKGRLKMNLKGE